MSDKKSEPKLIYFTDAFPANKMLKRLLNKLRDDKIRIFILASVDEEDAVESIWFSKDPSYRALGLTARLQHKINKFLDNYEDIIEEDIND